MERFSVATIAYVTGYTCSTVTSWAAKQNKSTKRGKVEEHAAIRLRTALEVMGAINRPFELGV